MIWHWIAANISNKKRPATKLSVLLYWSWLDWKISKTFWSLPWNLYRRYGLSMLRFLLRPANRRTGRRIDAGIPLSTIRPRWNSSARNSLLREQVCDWSDLLHYDNWFPTEKRPAHGWAFSVYLLGWKMPTVPKIFFAEHFGNVFGNRWKNQ